MSCIERLLGANTKASKIRKNVGTRLFFARSTREVNLELLGEEEHLCPAGKGLHVLPRYRSTLKANVVSGSPGPGRLRRGQRRIFEQD